MVGGVKGGEELGWGEVAEGLVRADVVVGVFPGEEVGFEAGDGRWSIGAVVELFAEGAVGAFDTAVELGAAGRSSKRRMPFCWQASSKSAMNSEPPSTWIALTGNGIRAMRSSSARLASKAVAFEAMVGTDQRLTTSTVVNCLRTTPGSGRTSMVSIWTMSPGTLAS